MSLSDLLSSRDVEISRLQDAGAILAGAATLPLFPERAVSVG
jgi:hypothetical protein